MSGDTPLPPKAVWNLVELRRNVEVKFGRAQLELLRPCLDSVVSRQHYASYHYHEAKKRFDAILGISADEESLFMRMLGTEDADGESYRQNEWEAGAHVLACVQSLHALADTLGHAIYFSLGMNLVKKTALGERQINLQSVIDKLAGEFSGRTLVVLLKSLINDDDYTYLSDLVNHSKHRSVVRASVQIDMTGAQSHGLIFASFRRGDVHHPQRRVKELLTAEYDRQARLLVSIGQTLNLSVQSEISD